MTTPLVCERCPVRSVRGDNDTLTSCSCTPGYEMKLGQCVGKLDTCVVQSRARNGASKEATRTCTYVHELKLVFSSLAED